MSEPYQTWTRRAGWCGVAAGLLLPAMVSMAVEILRGQSPIGSFEERISNLFRPGYNEFLIAVFNTVPFALVAVASRLSGTRAHFWGIVAAVGATFTFSLWFLIAIRTTRSSTAGIGYLFFPIELSLTLPITYGVGFLLGKKFAKPAQVDIPS